MRERRFASLPDGERADTERVTVIVSRGTEDERTTSPLEIARGDRLRIGATHWEKQLFNGTVVTVEDFKVEMSEAGTEPSVLISARTEDGRHVSFRHDEIRDWYGNIRLDHGYALTITSAQGLTVDRTFLLADARPSRETIYPAATRHREGLDIYVNRAPLALDIADRRADNDREVAVTDTEIRGWLAERWSRSQPKEAALDYMADGVWEDRREHVREDKADPPAKHRDETGEVRRGSERQRAGPHRTGYPAHRLRLASCPGGGFVRRRPQASSGGVRRSPRTDSRRGRLRRAQRGFPGNPHPARRAAETGRDLPCPAGRIRLPAGRAWRHRAQGSRRLRGPPCPRAPPPARGHDAATCTKSSGRRINRGSSPEMRQGVPPLGGGAAETAGGVPAGLIQPAGPDDGRPHTPAQATPPIETVAMPTERDFAGDPPAVAPELPVEKPSAPTEEQVAWDTYSALRQDWSRHLAAAERAGVHAIYVNGYKQLRARMEALAENPALEDRPRRSLGNVLAQLGEGTETRREIEDYLAAVKDRLEYRSEVLETVAIDLNKPVTGLTGYGRWRADIDRLAETGRRIMDGHDTYASHLNGIPLGLEHMRWALTDIGRLIGQGRQTDIGGRRTGAPKRTIRTAGDARGTPAPGAKGGPRVQPASVSRVQRNGARTQGGAKGIQRLCRAPL